MRRILPLIAILLLCAGAMCLALSLGSVAPPHFKSAHAQVPMTGAGLGAPGGGGGGSFSITYESVSGSSSSSATIDYGTMSYGSGCTREVVVIGASNFLVGAPTVASVSMTNTSGITQSNSSAAASVDGGSFGIAVDFYQASPTGTSGDVQVTYNNAPGWFGGEASRVAVYCLVTATPTAAHGNNDSSGSSSGNSASIVVPSGGGGLAAVAGGNNGGPTVYTWVNASQDVSGNPSGNLPYSAAHITATGTPTISVTNNTSSNSVMGVVTWSP